MHQTLTATAVALAIASLALAAPAPLLAQDEAASSPASWQEMIDGFFAHVAAGEAEKAVDGLYQAYPYLDAIAEQVDQLKTNFANLSKAVGEFRGEERLAVQPIADRFVYVWYLAYFDRQPLQFHFSFYKPKDRWIVYQFSYDQGITDLARKMAQEKLTDDDSP